MYSLSSINTCFSEEEKENPSEETRTELVEHLEGGWSSLSKLKRHAGGLKEDSVVVKQSSIKEELQAVGSKQHSAVICTMNLLGLLSHFA